MNVQLNHILSRRRTAELERAGEQARLAREFRVRGRKLHHRKAITRLRARPARWLGPLIVPVMLAALALSAPAARADSLGQVTEFSTGLAAGSYPGWIAAGPDGNLWFTDFFNWRTNAIGRITPSGQITEFAGGLNPSADPVGIVAGPDGDTWFADDGPSPAIGRITPSGQITEFFTGLNPGSAPQQIALGADGNLWFTDQGTTRAIGRITPSGQITEFSAGLNPSADPVGITGGPDGNLWFTDNGDNDAIGRITPSGQITEFSTGLNPGGYPVGIAVGPDGNLWFADEVGAIGRIGRAPRPRSPRRRAFPAQGWAEVPRLARRCGLPGRGTRRPPGSTPSTATRGCATGPRFRVRRRRPTSRRPATSATDSPAGRPSPTRSRFRSPLPPLVPRSPSGPPRPHPRHRRSRRWTSRPGCSRLQGAGSGGGVSRRAARTAASAPAPGASR